MTISHKGRLFAQYYCMYSMRNELHVTPSITIIYQHHNDHHHHHVSSFRITFSITTSRSIVHTMIIKSAAPLHRRMTAQRGVTVYREQEWARSYPMTITTSSSICSLHFTHYPHPSTHHHNTHAYITYPSTYPSIHPYINPSIHPSPSVYSFIYSLFIHSFIHTSIHSSISIHACIHPAIHPSSAASPHSGPSALTAPCRSPAAGSRRPPPPCRSALGSVAPSARPAACTCCTASPASYKTVHTIAIVIVVEEWMVVTCMIGQRNRGISDTHEGWVGE